MCTPKSGNIQHHKKRLKRTNFGRINGHKTMWSNQNKPDVKLSLQIERNSSIEQVNIKEFNTYKILLIMAITRTN